jgi:hypothetical protein
MVADAASLSNREKAVRTHCLDYYPEMKQISEVSVRIAPFREWATAGGECNLLS